MTRRSFSQFTVVNHIMNALSTDSSSSLEGKERRTNTEQMSTKVAKPSQFDVLFGRGKPYQGHAGNIRLHKVVDLYKSRYSQARRHEKTEIAEEIVQFIKTGGEKAGRFLKRVENEEVWIEVTDTIARDKVSHALRGKPRKESESKVLQQAGALEGLFAKKRSIGVDTSLPLSKRQKLQQIPNLELFAGPISSALNAAGLVQSRKILSNATPALSSTIQQQLYASALAERQLAAGLLPRLGGIGPPFGLSTPSGFGSTMMAAASGDMNPILIQRLAAERQLRADPRFWM